MKYRQYLETCQHAFYCIKKLVFVAGKLFKPRLIFVGKSRNLP